MFLIILLGLVLRTLALNQSLWLDEATSALVAKMSFGDIFTKFIPGDFHPPLYYLILNTWVHIFGASEVFLRIPSVIFGLLSVYLVYRLAGKLPALLLATSGLHVYYSQEARMYSLLVLIVTATVLFFQNNVIKKGGVGDFVIFGILLAIGSFTDYLFFLILPVFVAYSIIRKKSGIWWRNYIMSHIILLAFYVPWIPTLLKQLKLGLGIQTLMPFWLEVLGKTSFKNITLIPIKFMIGRVGFDNSWIYSLVILVFTVLVLIPLYRSLIRFKESLIYWLWLPVPIILGVLISFWVPILSYFRFIFCLPAFYILISKGIEKMGKWRVPLSCLIVALNLTFSVIYLTNPRYHREDWREAAKAVGTNQVVFPSKTQTEGLKYYGKGGQIVEYSNFNGEYKDIWLSRYVWEVVDPEDMAKKKIEGLGYNRVSEVNFNGVVLWQYRKD